jgi:hypothetical protein
MNIVFIIIYSGRLLPSISSRTQTEFSDPGHFQVENQLLPLHPGQADHAEWLEPCCQQQPGQDRINASYRDLHLWITVRPQVVLP